MDFELAEAELLLGRTPAVLRALLLGLPERWLRGNEGPETWSPLEVLAHLIEGEKTNWMPRVRVIYEQGEEGQFAPFDRFAHLRASEGRSVNDLLDEFAALRAQSLEEVRALQLTPADLGRTGQHPEFGRVTLGQLLATWTAHDQAHLVQLSRTLARQYREAVGPWQAYLSVMR